MALRGRGEQFSRGTAGLDDFGLNGDFIPEKITRNRAYSFGGMVHIRFCYTNDDHPLRVDQEWHNDSERAGRVRGFAPTHHDCVCQRSRWISARDKDRATTSNEQGLKKIRRQTVWLLARPTTTRSLWRE